MKAVILGLDPKEQNDFQFPDSTDVLVIENDLKESEVRKKLKEFQPDIIFCNELMVSWVDVDLIEENHTSIFLCLDQNITELPEYFLQGKVDDILLLPLRLLDLKGKLRWHYHLSSLKKLEIDSSSIHGIVEKLQEDIRMAEKIQRHLIKDKFTPSGPLSVKSKYWCGLKSGGDYFDVIDMKNQHTLAILLADSSSYRLSNTFLRLLLRYPYQNETFHQDPKTLVDAIFAEINPIMRDKDQLTLFFGLFDKRTLTMNYVSAGNFGLVHRSNSEVVWIEKNNGNVIKPGFKSDHIRTGEVFLEPEDRLILCSDGVLEVCQKQNGERYFDQQILVEDPYQVINEVGYSIHKSIYNELQLNSGMERLFMPEQDCSLLVIDVAKNVLRLARTEGC